MTPTEIAQKISDILGVKYSHHDLHFVDYHFADKHSILTAYQGVSPFTFSVLEDGSIFTLTSQISRMLFSEKLKPHTLASPQFKDIEDELNRLEACEKWIKENNIMEILIENLSDYYKEKMENIRNTQK